VPGREPSLTLAELIDLECQLAVDRQRDRQTLRERDRALAPEVFAGSADGQSPSRHEVFRCWLRAIEDASAPSPGRRVQAVYRLAAVALALLGLISGAGTGAAVLHYDGTQPVNIVHFLTVFVGLQLVLALFALARMLPRPWLRAVPGFGPLHETLRHVGYRQAGLERWLSRLHGDGGRVAASLARLRSWGTIYAEVERWMLLALTQRTAVFFNLGALACCLYLIAVTDLAFAWSTTLALETETMTRVLQSLALPWRWMAAAVPSAELVEASRYFRQAGQYDPVMLKDWWAFLVAALLTYGLMPRLILWGYALWRAHASRRGLTLDHGDCEALYERLVSSVSGWEGESAPTFRDEESSFLSRVGGNLVLPGRGAVEDCTILCWGDVPLSRVEAADLVRDRFGWKTGDVHAVGGKETAGQDAMREQLATGSREQPVLLLAEAWEAPGKAVRNLLRDVRGAVTARRLIVVCLLGEDADGWTAPRDEDLRLWEHTCALLGDPYLRVEPVVAA
jgi:hypothetical protein